MAASSSCSCWFSKHVSTFATMRGVLCSSRKSVNGYVCIGPYTIKTSHMHAVPCRQGTTSAWRHIPSRHYICKGWASRPYQRYHDDRVVTGGSGRAASPPLRRTAAPCMRPQPATAPQPARPVKLPSRHPRERNGESRSSNV
jgi:hypothetical protein